MPAERNKALPLLARIAQRPADALAVVAAQQSPGTLPLEDGEKFNLMRGKLLLCKTCKLSFENHSQNVTLPTPKLHAIYQRAIFSNASQKQYA